MAFCLVLIVVFVKGFIFAVFGLRTSGPASGELISSVGGGDARGAGGANGHCDFQPDRQAGSVASCLISFSVFWR
jgi:hypothetical protein